MQLQAIYAHHMVCNSLPEQVVWKGGWGGGWQRACLPACVALGCACEFGGAVGICLTCAVTQRLPYIRRAYTLCVLCPGCQPSAPGSPCNIAIMQALYAQQDDNDVLSEEEEEGEEPQFDDGGTDEDGAEGQEGEQSEDLEGAAAGL